MPRIRSITNTSLGAPGVQAFKSTQQEIIKDMRDAINKNLPTSTTGAFDSLSEATTGSGLNVLGEKENIIQGSAATVTLTTQQSGSLVLFDRAAGITYTLPPATAANTGIFYQFMVTTTITTNAAAVFGATPSDLFVAGSNIEMLKSGTVALNSYSPNGTTNYKISSNGTTTGGVIGDVYTFYCLGLNKWLVNGFMSNTGTAATPFAG